MTKLTLHPVASVDELVYPELAPRYSLESRAIQFFTDFYHIEPLVIESTVSALDARNTMIKTHVRLKIVVDDQGHFLGVVSAGDLTEQKIVAQANLTQSRIDEVSVTELMVRKTDLLALSIEEVIHASIGDVVSFLKDNHQQHCLVIDTTMHQIRGIFSSSDISRKLCLPINIHEQSSFSHVYSASVS